MRTTRSRPPGRVILGAAAVAAIAVITAVVAAGVYIFGGGGSSTAHAKLTTATVVPTAGESVFTIDSSASEATFTTHEVLFGQPNTVVGKTTAVTGEVLVNKQDPSKSRLGQIQVDLTTLVTSPRRVDDNAAPRASIPCSAWRTTASIVSKSKGINTTGTDHAESASRSAGVNKLTLVVRQT